MPSEVDTTQSVLIIGASRALGLGLTQQFLDRGWRVIATVRGDRPGRLHQLAAEAEGKLTIEQVDITEPDQIAALSGRLSGRSLDLLFVNAGVTNEDQPVEEVSTDDFTRVMLTNALSPMRVIAGLRDLVSPTGTIGVMSSRQGSISMNERGGHEVYRASKSALNQLMRSYAARHRDDNRTLLLMHPGWVQTELGGEVAPLTVDQSAHGVADVLEEHQGAGGLHFLDHEGNVVAW